MCIGTCFDRGRLQLRLRNSGPVVISPGGFLGGFTCRRRRRAVAAAASAVSRE
jgi:hypothetical protein